MGKTATTKRRRLMAKRTDSQQKRRQRVLTLKVAGQIRPGRIVGTATTNAQTGKLEVVHIQSVSSLEPLALGADFFIGHTFDELARLQGVEPLLDISTLAGGWPDDEDPDLMLADIYRQRGC